MTNIVIGLLAIPVLVAGGLLLVFPPLPGLPPGWMIVLVMFAVPLLGMSVRRFVSGEGDGERNDPPEAGEGPAQGG